MSQRWTAAEFDHADEEYEEEIERPDVARELSRLKDFQRKTAQLVFEKLYLDDRSRHRFLVADEVGLGKTLVARGVIAKTLAHLWDKEERLDIIYLCSNQAIAKQNVRKLLPEGVGNAQEATRITLLPTTIGSISSRKVNVFALTPGTSLDLKGNLGVMKERALICQMLQPAWGLPRRGAVRFFAGNAGVQRFDRLVRQRGPEVDEDAWAPSRFLKALEGQEGSELRARVVALADWFNRYRRKVPRDITQERNEVIGRLRQLLATTCIDMLEPDLIILDEFQRFRDVLDGTGPAGEMAKQLFEYESGHSRARVLLLSATPYKMYTVHREEGGEDHYQDFIRTVSFLLDDDVEVTRLSSALEEYRRQLYRLGQGTSDDSLAQSRDLIERTLRKVMVRTERLAVTADRSGMLVERGPMGVGLEARDAVAYREMQAIAKALEHPDTMEFWKSAPWLLSFMEGYKLRKDFDERSGLRSTAADLVPTILSSRHLILDGNAVEKMSPLDPAHGRLRWLMDHVLGAGLWKLLWLPPTLPYYQLDGPFAEVADRSPTKALLFSAWRVVPRALAAVLSHEAERRSYALLEGEDGDLSAARVRLGQTLRFQRQEGRLSGMPVLAMMYPCSWMARECDPLRIGAGYVGGEPLDLSGLLAAVKERLEPAVRELTRAAPSEGTADEAWYWAAPILLDRKADQARTQNFFDRHLAHWWSGRLHSSEMSDQTKTEDALDTAEEEGEEVDEGSLWNEHVDRARQAALGKFVPRGAPPADLVDVLALLAVAGPATVCWRSLRRIGGEMEPEVDDSARHHAAEVGWHFRSLFNQPDSTAVIRAVTTATVPYWRQCLEYSGMGGLQGVLDEYLHLLKGEFGGSADDPENLLDDVVPELIAALSPRRGAVGTHHFAVDNGACIKRSTSRVRARFAVRFGEERADMDGNIMRADTVRKAFNSPFAPFVLATTSVGQEGLDFHPYCHAVVHWNLPGNPVDMEQREGRVHRFKGHAVRKNVARRHRLAAFASNDPDPWEAMFAAACAGREAHENELIPFWVYPDPDGAAIERYAPSYMLSRETERLEALRRSLAIYRMVFGQPRQEELLAYLARTLTPEELTEYDERLRVSLAP